MTSEPWAVDTGQRPASSADPLDETVLATEFEPTADGGTRAILYPSDGSGTELATRWLATEEALLVELSDVR